MYTIHIEPLAPTKPQVGARCNGCGVCCLFEPCPLGRVLFRRRRGACPALAWDSLASVYRCGVLLSPKNTAKQVLPLGMYVLVPLLALLLALGARRWIAAGLGCDSTLEPVPSSSDKYRHNDEGRSDANGAA